MRWNRISACNIAWNALNVHVCVGGVVQVLKDELMKYASVLNKAC